MTAPHTLEVARDPSAPLDPAPDPTPRGRDVPRRRAESLVIFGLAVTIYIGLGSWLVSEKHLVGFETLEHLNRALMLWHNDPAKLAAIGVDDPPLLTALLTPVTIVTPWAASLAVVPVMSAICLATALTVLNTLLRRCGLDLWVRMLVVLAVSLNPMWVYQATSGRPQVVATLLLVAAVSSLLAWYFTADIRFVLGAGVLLGVMFLATYSAVIWAALAGVFVASVLARARATGRQVEGTLIGFGLPVAYLAAGWFGLVWLSRGTPWTLFERSSVRGPSGEELLTRTLDLVVATSPLTLVVLPLLLVTTAMRRDLPSSFLAAAVLVAAGLPAVTALLGFTDEPFAHHNGLPLFALTVIGGVWVLATWRLSAGPASLVLVVALAASMPWTWQAMRTYDQQRIESNFIQALSSGERQEGTTSRSGNALGIQDEMAMATYILDHLPSTARVLTDDAQTYAVMLMTGRPWLFLDRVDGGDSAWLDALADPGPEITHLLISTQPDDLIATAHPDLLDQGADAVAFRTDRYALIILDRSVRAEISGEATSSPQGES